MNLRPKWLPGAAALGFLANALHADDASAHVKWFCAFDVAGQPRNLENVLCANFELLVGAAMLVLLMGCLVERTPIAEGMHRAFDRVFDPVQANTELMFRAGCAFFFISIWATGGILLTPELKTTSTAIGFLHLGIAAGMLSRKTMPLLGAGHRDLVRRRHLAIRRIPSGGLSGVPRRRRLPGADRRAEPVLRHAAARRGALGRGDHADVGVDREVGVSAVDLPADQRQPVDDAWATTPNSSCRLPA